MAEPVLELRGVVKEYGERVVSRVLRGVDLRLDVGEFAALVGPSGSGKSTLLNLIGLLDRPTSGSIRVRGHETTRMSEEELTHFRGSVLGFVFQFHHLLPAFTALENVLLPSMGIAGHPDPERRREARELLRRVGMAGAEDRRATDLSGGQQQRVAIARALSMSPPLVLADEPTGNLDTKTADQIFELLREFNRERGTAFLVVTHDPRLAGRCDRIIDLVDGRIVSDRSNTPGQAGAQGI
jgi:lipoprotein-releasing system ATP-binding protein